MATIYRIVIRDQPGGAGNVIGARNIYTLSTYIYYASAQSRTFGTISSVSDAGGGYVTIHCSAPHGLSNGDEVELDTTPNYYDGIFTISSVTASTFNILDTWVATATGIWEHFTHEEDAECDWALTDTLIGRNEFGNTKTESTFFTYKANQNRKGTGTITAEYNDDPTKTTATGTQTQIRELLWEPIIEHCDSTNGTPVSISNSSWDAIPEIKRITYSGASAKAGTTGYSMADDNGFPPFGWNTLRANFGGISNFFIYASIWFKPHTKTPQKAFYPIIFGNSTIGDMVRLYWDSTDTYMYFEQADGTPHRMDATVSSSQWAFVEVLVDTSSQNTLLKINGIPVLDLNSHYNSTCSQYYVPFENPQAYAINYFEFSNRSELPADSADEVRIEYIGTVNDTVSSFLPASCRFELEIRNPGAGTRYGSILSSRRNPVKNPDDGIFTRYESQNFIENEDEEFFDAVVLYEDPGVGYTTVTSDAQSDLSKDLIVISPQTTSYLYLGSANKFRAAYFEIGPGRGLIEQILSGVSHYRQTAVSFVSGAYTNKCKINRDSLKRAFVKNGVIDFSGAFDDSEWITTTVNGLGPYYWVRLEFGGGIALDDPTYTFKKIFKRVISDVYLLR